MTSQRIAPILTGAALLVAGAPAVVACTPPAAEQSRHADTAPKVREAIGEILGVDAARLKPEARIVEDLKGDSLDCVEIVMALEEKFGISIPDADVPALKTVGDAISYIDKRRK